MTLVQIDANELARLKAAAAAAAARPTGALRLKVSEKGAVSVYGLGRWPVTLYRGQMERLLDAADAIRQFIATNADTLHTKD